MPDCPAEYNIEPLNNLLFDITALGIVNFAKTMQFWECKLSSDMVIEKMTLGDLQRVMEIERESFSSPWSESAYITEISNQSAYYIVGKIEGLLIGYAGMWTIMDEAHITTIAVDKNYRGRKYGERLLVALLDEAVRRKMRRVTLEVRVSNRAAQRLYLKYGFSGVAIRKGYYSDNREDALIMWADDILSDAYQEHFSALKEKLGS